MATNSQKWPKMAKNGQKRRFSGYDQILFHKFTSFFVENVSETVTLI
jgi:hypothetical protein